LGEQLVAQGWQEEPVVVGAQSSVGSPRPKSCADVVDVLSGGDDDVELVLRGYQHDNGSYLLRRQ
jgi:hypothetical protein